MPQKHSIGENLYSLFYTVRKRLSETTAAYWSDLEIYAELNRGQQHIAKVSKCLTKTVTVTTVENTQEYDLVDEGFSDIIDISENGVWFYQNGTVYNSLTFKTIKDLNREFPGWKGVTASVPQYYYYNKTSKTIGIYPKPNATNVGAYLFVDGSYKPKILNAGTASAGATTTLTLATGSATVPYPNPLADYYNDLYIEIYGGTGAGERAKITDYAASVCTIDFTTTPDTTTVYGMVPEISEEAHYLMELYALWKLWPKGGSRTTLGEKFKAEYFQGLSEFVGDFLEDEDEMIVKDSYR